MSFKSLPNTLPILDLPGTILLPKGHLPLVVGEARYRELIDYALGNDRLVGVVQTEGYGTHEALFKSGCAGRITTFAEGENDRYFVVISGICRFELKGVVEPPHPFLFHKISCEPFAFDLLDECEPPQEERDSMLKLLQGYLAQNQISFDMEQINNLADDRLITSLAMMCPFEPREKQAILESPTHESRSKMMAALIELSLLKNQPLSWMKH